MSLACPDPLADRRFAYGRAALAEGDWSAAADLFAQTLELVPHWAPAHYALGEAREKLGDRAGAARAFRAALAADPSDTQGAAARLAFVEGHSPDALPQSYVANLFNGYAPRFETHLTRALGYRGPALIIEALDETAPGRRFARALDLGCGTGLMGEAVRSRVDRLAGVDLAPAMTAMARERGVYDEVATGDALAWCESAPAGGSDLILAADVLCYVGDLTRLFSAVARALASGGLFAVTAETFAGEGFRLRETMRFVHAPGYVEAVAKRAHLVTRIAHPAWARREAGAETPGLVAVFERT
jgi:predicted TPR repeat methyltransferase